MNLLGPAKYAKHVSTQPLGVLMSDRQLNERFDVAGLTPDLDGFSDAQCQGALAYLASRFVIKYGSSPLVALDRMMKDLPFFHFWYEPPNSSNNH